MRGNPVHFAKKVQLSIKV